MSDEGRVEHPDRGGVGQEGGEVEQGGHSVIHHHLQTTPEPGQVLLNKDLHYFTFCTSSFYLTVLVRVTPDLGEAQK